MSNIQPFDPNTFKQRVQDHIVATFGSLIPPEQFELMVNAQVKAFFEDEREWTLKQDGHYGQNFNVNMRVTPFRQMVWEQVRKEVQGRLEKQFAEGGESRKALQEVIDSWFALPEVREGEVLKAQELMLAMSMNLFMDMMRGAGVNTVSSLKSSLYNAFMRAGMPSVASDVMNSGPY